MLLEVSGKEGFTAPILFDYDAKTSFINYTVDTGADITCCSATLINSSITEDTCIARRFETVRKDGIVQEDKIESVIFYKIPVSSFRIGKSIILGEQYVYITFDKRFSSSLLGRDILNQVYWYYALNEKLMYLTTEHQEIIEYVKRHK